MRKAFLILGVMLLLGGAGSTSYLLWQIQEKEKAEEWKMVKVPLPDIGENGEPIDPPLPIRQEIDISDDYLVSSAYQKGVRGESEPEPKPEPKPEKKPNIETTVWDKRPAIGERVGTLEIEAINQKIPIWSGVGDQELAKGIGHHITSVLPGENDVVALAGHRETALRHADKIKKGEPLIFRTQEGTFRYSVTKTWIADAKDRTVVSSVGKPVVRLYTCYPLSALYSGYAPERYVIEAELVDN